MPRRTGVQGLLRIFWHRTRQGCCSPSGSAAFSRPSSPLRLPPARRPGPSASLARWRVPVRLSANGPRRSGLPRGRPPGTAAPPRPAPRPRRGLESAPLLPVPPATGPSSADEAAPAAGGGSRHARRRPKQPPPAARIRDRPRLPFLGQQRRLSLPRRRPCGAFTSPRPSRKLPFHDARAGRGRGPEVRMHHRGAKG